MLLEKVKIKASPELSLQNGSRLGFFPLSSILQIICRHLFLLAAGIALQAWSVCPTWVHSYWGGGELHRNCSSGATCIVVHSNTLQSFAIFFFFNIPTVFETVSRNFFEKEISP